MMEDSPLAITDITLYLILRLKIDGFWPSVLGRNEFKKLTPQFVLFLRQINY